MRFKTIPDSKAVDVDLHANNPVKYGFVWVDGIPEEYVEGDIKDAALVNVVRPEKVPGYWHVHGRVEGDSTYAEKAGQDEKVIYILHGEFLEFH